MALAVFTALLVLISAFQIGFLFNANDTATKASNAAKDAANAAIIGNALSRQALIADQRPWISVAIEPAGPIRCNDEGFQVSYKITFKNIGKRPALKVTHVEAIILEIL